MALTIRMRQQGANSRQRFRLVVTDSRNPRDGKYLEMIGWYNPFGADEKNYFVDIPRVQYWLSQGAQISDRVKSLVKRFAPEVVQELNQKKIAKQTKKREQKKKA
ncbi:MAG: 30S ribosomal protein S16 [Verrucomicrobia bacterium]|nr:30S ribosomal protein S16 [Verrucomicrobiota bacterium]MDE3048172.1 30S ribosomal protein S16 [Verrucomicrobiota bacterium]